MAAIVNTVEELQAVHQRDLNRMTDSDRNTRKRGLQKLLDDVPWTSGTPVVCGFAEKVLLPLALNVVVDPIEKCRELGLKILLKILSCVACLQENSAAYVLKVLGNRMNEVPFPEPAEELRLLVLQAMSVVVRSQICNSAVTSGTFHAPDGPIDAFLPVLCKSLQDSFPAAKTEASEIAIFLSARAPASVQMHFRQLLKSLIANVFHQHSKVRSMTLKALASSLLCVSEDFEAVMKDPVLPVLRRLEADRSAHTRRELAVLCGSVLAGRATAAAEKYQSEWTPVAVEHELLAVLVMLCSDESEEVRIEAKSQVYSVSSQWELSRQFGAMVMDIPIGDAAVSEAVSGLGGAEAVLKEGKQLVPMVETSLVKKGHMIRSFACQLIDLYLDGASGWTVDSKLRNLRALGSVFEWSNEAEALVVAANNASVAANPVTECLPRILSVLGPAVGNEDSDVRVPAQMCCESLGRSTLPEEALDLLLARVEGESSGTDTASQRSMALLLLTSLCKGFQMSLLYVPVEDSATGVNHARWLPRVTRAIASMDLLDYRDLILRESLVLLIRSLISGFASYLSNPIMQRDICLCLLFLCGRCAFEADRVPDAARAELLKLAPDGDVPSMLAVHFSAILNLIIATGVLVSGSNPSEMVPIWASWSGHSARKAAFEVLVRECPVAAWAHAALILPVLCLLTKAKPRPADDTEEGITAKYNAQSGHEVLTGEVDVRVSMIALTEGLLRAGALDWKCGAAIADSSAVIIKDIIMPNLVWRSGRVESTVRKVALVATHSLLRAGSVSRETLFAVAGQLVPAIVSNLDDQEAVPRQLCCFCLDILFTRLRGAFGDQSIHEIYPKLLKRLDDSDDSIRKAICKTFCSFLWSSDPKNFSGTTLDYSLDQLFLHLDDPDENIQNAVLEVILTAKGLNEALVKKKADINRMSHRSTAMCDKVVQMPAICLQGV